MNIQIKRFLFKNEFTIGKLFIDGKDLKIFTLEDKVREIPDMEVEKWKVPSKTAIPTGKYGLILDFSNRFQKILPHILKVPGFEGVRIHSGNTDKDTEGCVLLGMTWDGKSNFIGSSKIAVEKFLSIIENEENIDIEIS